MDSRHLTAAEKQRELREWESRKTALPYDQGKGGSGLPDPDILPLCDRLNSLPGLCTVQSCSGHRPSTPGHLWLRLDHGMSRVFDRAAFRLAKCKQIEQIARIYASWGQEVTSITFKGNESGLLAESCEVIATFFDDLSKSVTEL